MQKTRFSQKLSNLELWCLLTTYRKSYMGLSKNLVWLIGAMVCLLAAPWVQLSVSAGNGWPYNVLRHHWLMPISCHFGDCKALLVTSLTHVSGAIIIIIIIIITTTMFMVLSSWQSHCESSPGSFDIASVQTFTFTLEIQDGGDPPCWILTATC